MCLIRGPGGCFESATAELQGHRHDYMILKLEWEMPRTPAVLMSLTVWRGGAL